MSTTIPVVALLNHSQPSETLDLANGNSQIMQGASLVEVLVSLLLVMGTSVPLLTQQWHASQMCNQEHLQMRRLLQDDNLFERVPTLKAII